LEEKEDLIKGLQERFGNLELDQNHGFANLRHSTSPVISIVSFGQEHVATIEEDIMEQHSQHARRENPSLLSLIV